MKKQASFLEPHVALSELADEHDVNITHVPKFGVVVFVPGVKAHYPSDPPPKQDSFDVYEEQVDYGMQFTPLETHLTPVIAVAHDELVVNNESVHYFNLQTLVVVDGVDADAFVIVVAH